MNQSAHCSTTRSVLSRRVAAAALVAAASLGAVAPARAAPPGAAHGDGRIDYLSGGIGADSAAAMQAESRHWPLTLEFAARDKPHDDWLADVDVRVRDEHGHTVLKAHADGPFLLARLQPGRYEVEATFAGKTLREPVSVTAGHPVRSVLVWPHAWLHRGA